MNARDLLNGEVRNAQGETLGHIADVLIEPTSGRVVWIKLRLIDTGKPAAGCNRETCIEIPWSQFQPQQDALLLNVSASALRRETARRLEDQL